MKISASLYSNKDKDLLSIAQELDNYLIDYFHFDCLDDFSVFNDINKVKKQSPTPIDLHIITSTPEKYYQYIIESKVASVSFQIESIKTNFTIPKKLKSRIGIAINPLSDLNMLQKYQNDASFFLLTTASPGISGETFNYKCLDAIDFLRKEYSSKAIHVDGGINKEIASILRGKGVSCCVSGTYLLRTNYIGKALLELNSDIKKLGYHASDIMLTINQLPVININNISLEKVLTEINNYKLGFCLIIDNFYHLKGIITDGDIRREILRNINELNGFDVIKAINKHPVTLRPDQYLTDALDLLQNSEKPIIFIPITDERHILEGVISVHDLMKGRL